MFEWLAISILLSWLGVLSYRIRVAHDRIDKLIEDTQTFDDSMIGRQERLGIRVAALEEFRRAIGNASSR